MIRKQIVIRSEQEPALHDRAAALGISQSALVREAIDAFLGGAGNNARRQRTWEELAAGMNEAKGLGIGSRGRRWTREQLHER